MGESHGTSVVAGAVYNKLSHLPVEYFEVIDMVILENKSIDNIISEIHLKRPNIIGFSVNYGTYDVLKSIFESCKEYFYKYNPIILFGGPIATYIPHILLDNIYENAIIVVGEGDETAPMVIEALLKNESIESIPNLAFKKGNAQVTTIRQLVSVNKLTLPYRKHINEAIGNKVQIYVESSRGCSWAGCTFCLRGLTDVNGRKEEFRRFNIERVTSDILELSKSGIHVFTFADEDFLGGDMSVNEVFINEFEEFCSANSFNLSFDASLTVNSIFSNRYTSEKQNQIFILLNRLKKIGLRKIFLGIESGSNSQLKRYSKGHSKEEILNAINIIRSIDFELEIGFIMFDPLCSLTEIEENIDFLYENDLTQYVSFLSNELRLQINSNYLKILELYEKRLNVGIIDWNLDYNTISYSYKYVNEEVSMLIELVRFWNQRIRSIHYPLKNLSRYGDGGILGEFRNDVQTIITNLRNDYLILIKIAIQEIKRNGFISNYNKPIDRLLFDVSNVLLTFAAHVPFEIKRNPIFSKILETCKLEIESFKLN